MLKRVFILFALVVTLAAPFVLRPKRGILAQADATLVIITPHNEAIRQEFGRGFSEWYRERTGEAVAIDWRVIGGSAEISRFLEGAYTASFQNFWVRQLNRSWSREAQAGFQSDRLPASAPALMHEARKVFLASSVGCGIDLFFGGGAYDFIKQAAAGRLVDCGLLQQHPDWFGPEIIPSRFAGETYWDSEGRWIGSVLSSYGIIYNRDALRRLGIVREPKQWTDLADSRYVGEIALADPTKSSSIANAFQQIVQQQMQRRWQAWQAEPSATSEPYAVAEGWIDGLRLLQQIAANSRYFTDTSQKPAIDVASGDCAAGICIDFYGRQQEEALRRRSGSTRLGYVSPAGGTVNSVDPIALLRGAPHPELARAFIEYVLSLDGQKLWSFKPGAPGGPQEFALRRLPIRRDFYAEAAWKRWRSDPELDPFTQHEQLTYRPEWTGGLFRELAFIIRVMGQDTHPELVAAWKAILTAPEPARSQALAVMQDLSFVDYARAKGEIKQALISKNKVDEVRLARELGDAFRRRYAQARSLALRH